MPVRLLVTADLHFNHARSRPVAEELIRDMNRAGGDAVLVVGDTGISEGTSIEECLSQFNGFESRYFVAGNHELWTKQGDGRRDAVQLLEEDLPTRVREAGWQWLEGNPVDLGGVSLVGSVGWYDYSFAEPSLGVPRRFYERKVSPGAAARFSEFADLFETFTPDDLERTGSPDVPRHAMEIVARWNDGRHVLMPQEFTDKTLLDKALRRLESDLRSVPEGQRIVVGVHHVPFRELLPPSHGFQWDFARAYLGSERIGALLGQFLQISHVFCGHSHFPAQAQVGGINARNLGSGYRLKTFASIDV